jgi:hypothetical protein
MTTASAPTRSTGTTGPRVGGGLEDGDGHGAALAAILAAAIGAAALGLLVLLAEAGVFSAPTLYGPAGGLSGRSTFAVVAWLVAWFVLHRMWSGKAAPRAAYAWAIALVLFAVLATFPPVWGVFG